MNSLNVCKGDLVYTTHIASQETSERMPDPTVRNIESFLEMIPEKRGLTNIHCSYKFEHVKDTGNQRLIPK